jgi:transcriptional regulator with XRE-family HTH domain
MDQKNLIKEVCAACGFTQQDLADVLKVSKNTVARWARDELSASAPIMARLEAMAKSVSEKSSADSEILDRWHMIKGAADLQRFANHIARFEFWPEQTFASNPNSGSDEGWDGGSLDGTILVQAKFSDHSRAKGFKYIKESFTEEYQAATANKRIKKYILATNLDLLPSQCDLLRSFRSKKGPEIIIWNKETLTLRAKEHKWVLYHYFHYPQLPRFLPAFVFLQKTQYESECVGFEELLSQLLAFCKSDECLLVVKGGTHVGKTRLLYESVKLLSNELPDVKPWVLRGEFSRRCSETIEDEINISHGSHVVFLDDAHLHCEDVEDLTEYSHAARQN